MTVATSLPLPDFSSVFSASRAQAYSETASYSTLFTVPGAEKGVGVAFFPRISAANSYPLRFAVMVVARVISSHFPNQMSRTTVRDLSAIASHSVLSQFTGYPHGELGVGSQRDWHGVK